MCSLSLRPVTGCTNWLTVSHGTRRIRLTVIRSLTMSLYCPIYRTIEILLKCLRGDRAWFITHMCDHSQQQSSVSVNVPALFTKSDGEHACSHCAKHNAEHLSKVIPVFSSEINSLLMASCIWFLLCPKIELLHLQQRGLEIFKVNIWSGLWLSDESWIKLRWLCHS